MAMIQLSNKVLEICKQNYNNHNCDCGQCPLDTRCNMIVETHKELNKWTKEINKYAETIDKEK